MIELSLAALVAACTAMFGLHSSSRLTSSYLYFALASSLRSRTARSAELRPPMPFADTPPVSGPMKASLTVCFCACALPAAVMTAANATAHRTAEIRIDLSSRRGMLRLHEERDQRLRAALGAPVSMQRRIEARPWREHIGGVEVLARPEAPHRAVAQTDLHLAAEDEHPLRIGRAMPRAAKPDRAVAQLMGRRRKHLVEQRLRIAFAKRDPFLSESGAAITVGEEHDLRESHGTSCKSGQPPALGAVFLQRFRVQRHSVDRKSVV